jgi:N-methylhydantoinase A
VVSWRVAAHGPKPTLRLPAEAGGPAASDSGDPSAALKTRRPAYLPERSGFAEVPVYDRYRLAPGHEVAGPAIVEERESTVVVGPDARARIDNWRNLVIEDTGRAATMKSKSAS